jgi:hypothetical protein
MKILSIRQPGYLPFIGFFKKIQATDVFVFLDDVQYTRSDFDNRNKIRTQDDSMWLTIPIFNKTGQTLNEVKIDYSKKWVSKHKSSIEYNYEKAPYFEKYWKDIELILDKSWEKLIDLNMELISYFITKLEINTKTVFSSELNINKTGSEKLLEICKDLQVDTYLSGEFGRNYLDINLFQQENIKVIFEKFEHPTYDQTFDGFVQNMSIIDLLFNEGQNAKNILKNCKNF